MVQLTIDGKSIQAEKGTMILQTARDNLIDIPSLCDNESIAPYGACRLCLVEITASQGRKRLVTSCLYMVEEGLVVETASERVVKNRRMLLELLLSRCPDSERIRSLAAEHGVVESRFPPQTGNQKCILCAQCARVCNEIVGVSAISLVNRGVERQLTTPFSVDYSDACIGCGSCAYICPTNAITVEEQDGTRMMKWPHNYMEFKMKKCKVCDNYWAPEKQLEYIARISGTSPKDYDVCLDCRD